MKSICCFYSFNCVLFSVNKLTTLLLPAPEIQDASCSFSALFKTSSEETKLQYNDYTNLLLCTYTVPFKFPPVLWHTVPHLFCVNLPPRKLLVFKCSDWLLPGDTLTLFVNYYLVSPRLCSHLFPQPVTDSPPDWLYSTHFVPRRLTQI